MKGHLGQAKKIESYSEGGFFFLKLFFASQLGV